MADSTRRPTQPYLSVVIYFAIWQVVAIVSYARYAIEAGFPSSGLLRNVFLWSTCFYAWFLLTPAIFRLEGIVAGFKKPLLLRSVMLIGISIPVSWIAYIVAMLLADGAARIWGGDHGIRHHHISFGELLLEEAIFGCCVIAAFLRRKLAELREKELRTVQLAVEKSQLEAELRTLELETLRSRLNPHFLFNSLQNASVLAQQDPARASGMLTKLGGVLRAALRKEEQAETTLGAEVELTKAYISVEQIRFADDASVLFEIEQDVHDALVPGFLLQPIVENAMTHGRRSDNLPDLILIRGFREEDNLVLTVSDNGAGPPADTLQGLSMGIGLSSTCKRLELMYPEDHMFAMSSLSKGGTEVRIVLPYKAKGKISS